MKDKKKTLLEGQFFLSIKERKTLKYENNPD
jgi:hypothetical protein